MRKKQSEIGSTKENLPMPFGVRNEILGMVKRKQRTEAEEETGKFSKCHLAWLPGCLASVAPLICEKRIWKEKRGASAP